MQDPLRNEEEASEKKGFKRWMWYAIGGGVALVLISVVVGVSVSVSGSKKTLKSTNGALGIEPLPDCEVHEGLTCPTDKVSEMDAKWADHLWNTPPRGDSKWKAGYQDMNVLVGYARQIYNADRTGCTVEIYTKTKTPLDLVYYFDDVKQESASKSFDSSYTGILKVRAEAATGEKLDLADIDFVWNLDPIFARAGNEQFRNGQKGAIIELMGWPDEDVALECKHIADAGYLGVKLFPHQEHLMSYQPFEYELNPWYFYYQPVSYRLDSRHGTRDVLRKTIAACRKVGVRVYLDTVVNHMSAGGNDMSEHRIQQGGGCSTWGGKNSSRGEDQSPFYTHSYTYEYNQYTGQPTNVLEFPGAPYGVMDFHCDKPVNAWDNGFVMNTGWLVGLSDLDTASDYVRQRIADFYVDLISIGFSGFRLDAAKHVHPNDIAAIIAKMKTGLGGSIPDDWIIWLEVLTGGESELLCRDTDYSYTVGLTRALGNEGLSQDDIDKVKVWWSSWPIEPENDAGTMPRNRKVIQNDDHDMQNDGSSSRNLGDMGCVLVKGCSPDEHRRFEVTMFENPRGAYDNDVDYPIRLLLSSYYFQNGCHSPPDGLSDCSKCTMTCSGCKSRAYAKAYVADAQGYAGSDYTRVHRDQGIIDAMRKWMKF